MPLRERVTPLGTWLTQCREAAGLRQSDVTAVMAVVNPRRWANQGRICEFETGQKPVPPELVAALHGFFYAVLGDECPQPPQENLK